MSNRRVVLFVAAVAIQAVILCLVPARKLLTRERGRQIVLQVQPVDPYSIMPGYYVVLGYEISQPPDTSVLPRGRTIYAIVEEGADGIWHPVRWEPEKPRELPPHQVAIRGKSQGWTTHYGLETFFVPETERQTIADALTLNPSAARVEVRVDDEGHSALMRLLIGDKAYE